MFLLVSVRHVGDHPGEHQHGVSTQISISLGKTFLRISRIRKIPLTWILARDFVYVPPFISQILDFIYWTVLIFILIYFERRDTENQQYCLQSAWYFRRLLESQEIVATGVCDSWRRLKFKLLYSPLFFFRLVEDGDRRCDLVWASPWRCIFFPPCVLKRCSPLYFERKPNLLKILEGLLMRLVIFVNTIFQLNSLNIAVSVWYMSVIEMNRKQRNRPSVWISMITKITTAPPLKVVVPLLGQPPMLLNI